LAGQTQEVKRPVKPQADPRKGVTLVELICVLAIISILCALYLPTIARAFSRVKKFLAGW
jgi:prepilin-type N-terminal cleavage/methylation domain-containing protein